MGFGGSKKVSIPASPAPSPTPIAQEQQAGVRADAERRKMLARLGRQGTILVGLGGQQQVLGSTMGAAV